MQKGGEEGVVTRPFAGKMVGIIIYDLEATLSFFEQRYQRF